MSKHKVEERPENFQFPQQSTTSKVGAKESVAAEKTKVLKKKPSILHQNNRNWLLSPKVSWGLKVSTLVQPIDVRSLRKVFQSSKHSEDTVRGAPATDKALADWECPRKAQAGSPECYEKAGQARKPHHSMTSTSSGPSCLQVLADCVQRLTMIQRCNKVKPFLPMLPSVLVFYHSNRNSKA